MNRIPLSARQPGLALLAFGLAAALPAGADIHLAPLGSPRILVSDAPTLQHLRDLLNQEAESAVRFKYVVDNQVDGVDDYWGFEPWFAGLMGQVTGDKKYCAYAVKQTDDFVAGEEALIAAGERPAVSYDSYLEVGADIGGMSLVYDWCRADMTDAQRQRWRDYGNQAVWNVWHPRKASWGGVRYPWSGWSIDNPVNNYYFSFLKATALLGLASQGENPQADTWLKQFREVKLQDQLVPIYDQDLVGGGSREGTGYGTAMAGLFRLYDWWGKSTGERIADLTPHTRASMAYLMHAIVPSLDRLTPTGDHPRDSTAALFDYHRDYLQTLATLYPRDRLAMAARGLLIRSSVPRMQNPFMFVSDYLNDSTGQPSRTPAILNTAYWASGTGQFAMRDAWNKDSAYANFICGPYTESHAHRDQGSFTLFHGNWLAYDANIDSHSGLMIGEAWHNLVRIESDAGAATQLTGDTGAGPCEMLALAHDDLLDYASARVTPVYRGQVTRMEREFLYLKPGLFVVFDRAESPEAGARKIWTLNTPTRPSRDGRVLHVVNHRQRLDVTRLAPSTAQTRTVPWPTQDEDMLGGYRVDVVDANPGPGYFLHVLDAGQQLLKATRRDGEGEIGGVLQLKDGSRVEVGFNTLTAGGRLKLIAADGTVLRDGPLPVGIQAPALFANGE